MAVGSGLSSSFGIATETTVGTPAAVTRFFEFDSETLSLRKKIVQGVGLRGGGIDKRAARRILVSREAQGDVTLSPTTNGYGLLISHLLGSFTATATSIGSGLYQQIHNPGPLAGKTFTGQLVRPDTTGTLTQEAFTYTGCKVTGWEISSTQGGEVKLKMTVDALDEATPSNGFANTVLSALTVAGATSMSTAATIPTGSWVTVGIAGIGAEVVQTGVPSGAGPYTIPVVSPGGLTLPHPSASPVGSATGVNYVVGTALQAASYTAGTNLFAFEEGQLIAGGTTSVVGGVWTNTGGQPVGNVRKVLLKVKNQLKVDRYALGQLTRNEQLDNGFRDYMGTFDIEYGGRAFYDAFASDTPIAMQLKFTTPQGGVLQFYMPMAFQNDGSCPQVGGPDVIVQKIALEFLNDGTNGAMQVVYTSTDVSL